MPEHKAQITPPEQPTRVVQAVEVNDETANEDVVQACSDIVAVNVGNLLNKRLNTIEERLKALEFVDQDTLIHKIEELKAALWRLYQQVAFASYDYEYGFEDNEDHFGAKVDLPGENTNLLIKLKAITWVLELADGALKCSHNDIGELKRVIKEAQSRLADLEQSNNHKKEKATHAKTIKNREKRLKPKSRKHKDLVGAVNSMLNLDSKDPDALLEGADTLLAFLIKAGWVEKGKKKYFNLKPEGLRQRYQIDKIIEEVEETAAEILEDPNPALSQKARAERNRKRRMRKLGRSSQQMPAPAEPEDFGWAEAEEAEEEKIINMVEALPTWMQKLTPATNNKELLICALLSLTAFFALWQYTKPQEGPMGGKLPHPMHEIDRHIIGPDGKKLPYKLLCTSRDIGLDDKDLRFVIYENARRQSERILNIPQHIEAADIDKANKSSKAKPITVVDSKGNPLKFYISIVDFVQGFHGSEHIRTIERDDLDGPYNEYRVTMARSAKVTVTFLGSQKPAFEIPIDATVNFTTLAKKTEDPRENKE
ncbi:hypothetical protein ACFL3T_01385 [Patescibacteria group bacterium]